MVDDFMRTLSSEFLAPGARLGTWWVPADDDLNDEGDFDTLPQRREPGVLLPKANSGWALLLARQLPLRVSRPASRYCQTVRNAASCGGMCLVRL